MKKEDKLFWIINLESIACQLEEKTVKFILNEYCVKSIDELSPANYIEVWNELHYYSTDT